LSASTHPQKYSLWKQSCLRTWVLFNFFEKSSEKEREEEMRKKFAN
jgi:hypothetical protein